MTVYELQHVDPEEEAQNKFYLDSIEYKKSEWQQKKISDGHYHSQLALCYSGLYKSEECKMHAALVPEDAEPHEKAEALVSVARILIFEKQLEEAISHYQRAYDLEPEHDTAIEEMAWCYFELKEYQQAEAWFNKACTIDPEFEVFWEGLGRSLAQQEKYEDALVAFQKAKESCRNADNHYFYDHLIGQTYAHQNDFYRALDYYTKALEAKPTYGTALNDMAALYYNQEGDMTNAIDYLKKAEAAAEEEKNAYTLQMVYINLSRIYDKQKEFDLHEHYKAKLFELLFFGGSGTEDYDDEDDYDEDEDE
ncbi:MAG: tetratricopeptide repeat protein [Chitinophagaceae bacterium]